MKKSNLFLFLFFIIASTGFAQESTKTTQLPKIPQQEDEFIVSLTSDNWAQLDSGMTSKAFRSRGFSFMFMGEKMNRSGHFGSALGLGFTSQNVHSNSRIVYSADKSYTHMEPIATDYDLNKLSLNFLDAAFELRYRTNENKHLNRFKISAGIKGSLLLQSHTKYEDDNGKFKTYHVANLRDFQYAITGRIGYAKWAISGYYSFVGIFEDGKGPELIPYSIGFSFTP